MTEAVPEKGLRSGFPVAPTTGWNATNLLHQGLLLQQQRDHEPAWIMVTLGLPPSSFVSFWDARIKA